jgi:hypothetical protein
VTPKWREAQLEQELDQLLQSLSITLLASSPDGRYELVGSAFVLMAQKRLAVCVTAAHVLLDAARVQAPRGARDRWFEFQLEQTTIDLDRARLRAIWTDPSHPRACVILYAWTATESDLGFFVATFDDEDTEARFPSMSCSIDWRPPAIGQELAVFGSVAQWISDEVEEADGGGGFTHNRDFALRKGSVLSMDQGRGRLGQGPSFEMTVPFPPGLSGAPIIDVPHGGSPLTIRGIVCADLSPEGAFSDNTVAGLGTAMMIWPALGFRVPGIRFPGIEHPDALIKELLAIGALADVSGDPHGITVNRTATGAVVTMRGHRVSS